MKNIFPASGDGRRAFTLVEVMVSIAIFALLVTAVYSTWVLIIKSAQVGQEAAAQVQRQRIAVRTIEDSLTCIQSFQSSMEYYQFFVENGPSPQLSFVARLPDVFPRNGRFGDFNLRRLTFSVENVSETERDLVLRQNPILMDIDEDEQAVPLVLARNVQDFIVECWDTNAMEWAGFWESTNSLPTMVRVTLALGSSLKDTSANGPSIAIIRQIAVPSDMMPGAVQGTQGGGGGNSQGGVNLQAPGGGGGGAGGGGNNPRGGGGGGQNPRPGRGGGGFGGQP